MPSFSLFFYYYFTENFSFVAINQNGDTNGSDKKSRKSPDPALSLFDKIFSIFILMPHFLFQVRGARILLGPTSGKWRTWIRLSHDLVGFFWFAPLAQFPWGFLVGFILVFSVEGFSTKALLSLIICAFPSGRDSAFSAQSRDQRGRQRTPSLGSESRLCSLS